MESAFILSKNKPSLIRLTKASGEWTQNEYIKYLDDYGGYAPEISSSPEYVSDISAFSTISAEATDGDTFVGWFTIPSNVIMDWYRPTASEASVLISTSSSDSIRSLISKARYVKSYLSSLDNIYVLYPAFGTMSSTITFNPNGGEAGPKTQTVYSGSSVTLVSTYPGRSGYKFMGWSKSSTATTATYNAGGTYQWAEFSGNPTLYAVWAVAILVIYDPNGGTVSRVFDRLAKGETFPALPTASFSGQTTNRWYTAATGGTEIHQGDTVSQTSDFTLYAHWSVPTVTHTLTFNANGGTVSPASLTLSEGADYGTLPTPTRSGYTFVEWRTAPYVGSLVTSSTKMGTDDVTIYAIWRGNAITITLNPNGGTVSPTTKSVENGSVYGILPRPTRSGYVFDGWWTSATGGTKILATTKPTGNQTVYAHWKLDGGEVVPWVF